MSALPRCRIVPLPDHQTSFLIDDRERCRWHFGPSYPRPFFYPFVGPSGARLTRMGHPGAPDHDHHRSIWFAHEKVLGINFWSEQAVARIRQKTWLAYEDGDDECRIAVRLGWFDGHDPRELLEQELVAAVRPGPNEETLLELQATFRPVAESLELGKTNFGFLAVRVAKSISEHFGHGRLTNSEGATGEPAIIGQPARWMDYSGTVSADIVEGITYFDHPSNPGFQNCWHVRSDGWMGNAPCMRAPIVIQRSQPLVLRYLLHAHNGEASMNRAHATAELFSNSRPFDVVKSTAKHVAFQIRRAT